MAEKPKRSRPKRPAKGSRLEELIAEASRPGEPETPLEFVHRRMRELDVKAPRKKK